MDNTISILNSNILNIKNNLQQFLLLINNTEKTKFFSSNNNNLNINNNELDCNFDNLLNKYKSCNDNNYLENKLKKLLSHYSINNN